MMAQQIFTAQRMTSETFCERVGAFETIADAKTEAARMLTEARENADIQRLALETELAEARAKSTAEMEAEIAQYMAAEKERRMTEALHDTLRFSNAFEADFKASEDWLATLVVDGVRRVLGSLPPEQLDLEVVRSAIKESGERWKLELQVSQADHVQIEDLLRSAGAEFECIGSIVAKADLQPGQMFLLSAGGITDITVDVQLRTLINVIRSACLHEANVK